MTILSNDQHFMWDDRHFSVFCLRIFLQTTDFRKQRISGNSGFQKKKMPSDELIDFLTDGSRTAFSG
jgi:hypothetical protein